MPNSKRISLTPGFMHTTLLTSSRRSTYTNNIHACGPDRMRGWSMLAFHNIILYSYLNKITDFKSLIVVEYVIRNPL